LAKTWLYEANGGCAGEELKKKNISIELGFCGGRVSCPASEAGEAQLQKVPPRKAAMSFFHPREKFTTIVLFT
jgi:hypothetical protein